MSAGFLDRVAIRAGCAFMGHPMSFNTLPDSERARVRAGLRAEMAREEHVEIRSTCLCHAVFRAVTPDDVIDGSPRIVFAPTQDVRVLALLAIAAAAIWAGRAYIG